MRENEYFNHDVINEKLDFLIKFSWELLQKKIQYNYIEINKEASLQLQYANTLQSLISTSQYSDKEIIKVALEKTIYIQNKKSQEVDLIIETQVDNQPYLIAIEMKCYRAKTSSGGNRGAMDIFAKDVYEDIEILEKYKLANKDIRKTYFLAMTDYQNFVLPKDKSAKYWDYDISDGFMLNGPKDLTTPIGGKEINIHINGKYKFEWTQIDNGTNSFYFLLLEDKINELLNEGLEKETENKGYNGRAYTLYELRRSANNYSSKDPIEFRKLIKEKYAKIYNCPEETIPVKLLQEVYGIDCAVEEVWKEVVGYAKKEYLVSNFGRIKHRKNDSEEYRLVYQDEDESSLYKGYLKMKHYLNKPNLEFQGNKTEYSYHFIAYGFFPELYGKRFDIHHINNNGYDCRPDNLILLTHREHSKAHGYFVPNDKDISI